VSYTSTPDQGGGTSAHPAWCDLNRCTRTEEDATHYSAWVTLKPFSNRVVVRAYMYADNNMSRPIVMVAAYSPFDHPDDIADHAGNIEDTVGAIVMWADELPQLIELLSTLVATSQATPA